MFIDKVVINIKAGDGGSGAVNFHTEKFVNQGGPDGGDGGKGGDVIFVASDNANTLNEFYYKKFFYAQDGEKGGIKKCYGKQGVDMLITVPTGTVVKDEQTGSIIADMFVNGQAVTVLKGGRGGLGNSHFATSRRQSPSFAQIGEKTLPHKIVLELMTIADVGLVGCPNVGKSTLLSVVSSARPKIANYHFTTLSPNLGVVSHYDTSFTMADIPGLIDGASDGAGLGLEFLRHIERTRLLVHVVDISGSENRSPIDDFEMINNQLRLYNAELASRPMIVALNKIDMDDGLVHYNEFVNKYGDKYTIFKMSAIIHEGVKELLDQIIKQLSLLPKLESIPFEPFLYQAPTTNDYQIVKGEDGSYIVVGGLINDLARKVTMDDIDSFRYFQKVLRSSGIIDELKKQGIRENDTVVVGDLEFDFIE